MSIKWLARDLYRCQQEVERLEKRLLELPWDKRGEIEEELRRARATRDKLRRALDGRVGR
jgi:hypothetical protein